MNMSSRIRKPIVAMTVLIITASAQTAHSATIWDWLLGRSPNYQSYTYRAPNGYWIHSPATPAAVPAATYAAPTYGAQTYGAPSYAAPSYPTIVQPQAAVMATSAQSACDPCAQVVAQPITAAGSDCCQPAIQAGVPTNYAYRPQYRSTWFRVPVTTYRPVPSTVGAATQLQPCNTYTWQMRRTPLTRFRPLFGWGFRQPAAVSVPSVFAQQAAPGCGSCAPVTAPAASPAPYYNGTQSPLAPIPTTPPEGSGLPGTSADPNDPANQQPALRPGEGGSPSALRPGRSHSLSGQSHPAPASGSAGRSAGRRSAVVPIPDYERQEGGSPARIIAPPLLGPRDDHTAGAQPPAGAVTPIVWNVSAQPPKTRPATSPQPKSNTVWDDSGWESTHR